MTVTFTNNGPNASSGGDNPRLYINNIQFTASTINQLAVLYNSLPVSTIVYPNNAGNNFKRTIDNLLVYNRVLTASEVSSIVTNQTLSTTDNLVKTNKVRLYPNPAVDVLNIDSEDHIKSIEIYSASVQKVATSKDKKIQVSSFPKGVYLAKIEDAEGIISTQKFIKK